MKFTVDVECTPDEARQFLGLPDVKPMQQAVMAKLEAQMLEAANAFSPDAVLRTWMQGLSGGPDALREMFTRFFRPPTTGGGGSSGAPPARTE